MEDLILQKKMLVHEIYINTKEQSQIIQMINDEKLNELLDKREIMINNVIKLQQQITSVSLSAQAQADLSEINKEIHSIQTLEAENRQALEKVQARVKKDMEDNKQTIKNINMSNKILTSGYINPYAQNQMSGFYLDRKN